MNLYAKAPGGRIFSAPVLYRKCPQILRGNKAKKPLTFTQAQYAFTLTCLLTKQARYFFFPYTEEYLRRQSGSVCVLDAVARSSCQTTSL